MKEVKVTSTFSVYENKSQMSSVEQTVLQKAIDMLENVYAPYSGFYIGAAVLTDSGNIYGGCNQENASYPLCICGERVALYNAGANEPKTPVELLAIVSHNPKKFIDQPISPCGACRQVISEFAMRHKHDFPILLKGDGEMIYRLESSKELLPFGFDSKYL
ncbi:MAG: cytidine deaminase [Saprospiraceae bacterium]|jgi:cytidine deaminase|tara:strand:+ start:753 stop:1235 length:483 start_codon:yes stop_codon:yes gene_type:complete